MGVGLTFIRSPEEESNAKAGSRRSIGIICYSICHLFGPSSEPQSPTHELIYLVSPIILYMCVCV